MPTTTTIDGLSYLRGYLVPAEESALLESIDAGPWSTELRRRVQHHGYRYDYRRRRVDAADHLGPLPGWAAGLAQRLVRDELAEQAPDQLIVNEYLPGQGISAHVDCVPCFGDTILTISLGSTCVLTMSHPEAAVTPVPVVLEPGSVLRLAGDARYVWRHSIAARRHDVLDGRRRLRQRRVSLTFRRVIV